MNILNKQLAVGVLAGLIVGAGALAQNNAGEMRVDASAVTFGEIDAMNARAGDYSLKLVLAAKGSGDYLADVDVIIRSLPQRDQLVQVRTEGPLLMADLPPGRYEISATFDGVRPGAPSTVTRTLTVPRSGLQQAVIHFDTGG